MFHQHCEFVAAQASERVTLPNDRLEEPCDPAKQFIASGVAVGGGEARMHRRRRARQEGHPRRGDHLAGGAGPALSLEHGTDALDLLYHRNYGTLNPTGHRTGDDDAGIGALERKAAYLYDIPAEKRAEYLAWFEEYYPQTNISFRDTPR